MQRNNEEEEKTSREYFKKIQGDDESRKSEEKSSSISPDEYRRREIEYRQNLSDEEKQIKKTYEAMKKSFAFLSIGLMALALSFVGFFWLWPYFCTQEFSPLIQILILIPFSVSGIAGVTALIISIIKFFSIKKKVEESPDW